MPGGNISKDNVLTKKDDEGSVISDNKTTNGNDHHADGSIDVIQIHTRNHENDGANNYTEDTTKVNDVLNSDPLSSSSSSSSFSSTSTSSSISTLANTSTTVAYSNTTMSSHALSVSANKATSQADVSTHNQPEHSQESETHAESQQKKNVQAMNLTTNSSEQSSSELPSSSSSINANVKLTPDSVDSNPINNQSLSDQPISTSNVPKSMDVANVTNVAISDTNTVLNNIDMKSSINPNESSVTQPIAVIGTSSQSPYQSSTQSPTQPQSVDDIKATIQVTEKDPIKQSVNDMDRNGSNSKQSDQLDDKQFDNDKHDDKLHAASDQPMSVDNRVKNQELISHSSNTDNVVTGNAFINVSQPSAREDKAGGNASDKLSNDKEYTTKHSNKGKDDEKHDQKDDINHAFKNENQHRKQDEKEKNSKKQLEKSTKKRSEKSAEQNVEMSINLPPDPTVINHESTIPSATATNATNATTSQPN
jgi:hypothetical protein